MHRNNRFRGNRAANQQRYGDKKIEKTADADDSLVIKSFREYAEELNDKHDRYERIVKHSRDITIERYTNRKLIVPLYILASF